MWSTTVEALGELGRDFNTDWALPGKQGVVLCPILTDGWGGHREAPGNLACCDLSWNRKEVLTLITFLIPPWLKMYARRGLREAAHFNYCNRLRTSKTGQENSTFVSEMFVAKQSMQLFLTWMGSPVMGFSTSFAAILIPKAKLATRWAWLPVGTGTPPTTI